MRFVFLVLFAVSSIAHLYYSWRDEKRGRAITKPFLLLFLALYYVCSTENVSYLLLLALLTSWLGDVLLIPKGHVWFSAGGVSFMASHFLFIAVYVQRISFADVPWLPVIVLALIYCGVAAKIISMVWKTTPKLMRGVMYIYLLANSAMNVFAFMQLLTVGTAGAVVAYIGALLFFASDRSLFLVRYYGGREIVYKKHFTVMLTYILGKLLITQGILMLTI